MFQKDTFFFGKAATDMHEVGITRSLVEIAEQHLRRSGHNRVLSVSIAIGELSGVVADAVEFCFEAVTRDTLMAGSRLIIKRIAGEKSCHDCHSSFAADNQTFTCPQCGSFFLDIVAGDELKILELEVE